MFDPDESDYHDNTYPFAGDLDSEHEEKDPSPYDGDLWDSPDDEDEDEDMEDLDYGETEEEADVPIDDESLDAMRYEHFGPDE